MLLLRGASRVPRLLDALHARFSRLPGWVRLSTGTVTSVLTVYFGETVRTGLDWVADVVFGPLVGLLAGTPLGTWILVVLLLGLSCQVAVVNSRLEWLVRLVGRKSKGPIGNIVDTMEDDAATDGGRGHARDDSGHVTGSWKGIFAGIVAGAAVGSVFGVDGVTGGAVFGAFVGDEVERYVIRRRRRG